MRVRIIKPTELSNRILGQEYDLSRVEAETLIRWGQAEVVQEDAEAEEGEVGNP